MAQQTMYPAAPNSPTTQLSAATTDTATTISVVDASKLPAAPNLATIGVDETAEVVLYTGKTDNDLTGVTRGFSGTTAKAWSAGVNVARYFTSYDADTFRANIADHEGRIATAVQATTADVTYYVRTDGNDNNNGLANTAAGAFKTIQKALDSVPKELRHTVNINVAAGTYVEDVRAAGFQGSGSLTITGNQSSPSTVILNSVELYSNFAVVSVVGVTANTTTKEAFVVNRCVGFRLSYCQTTGTALSKHAVMTYFSAGVISGGNYSNRNTGISSFGGSQLSVTGVAGNGNNIGMYADDGGVILYSSDVTLTGATAKSAGAGIITPGVLNPWGDNTWNARPAARAYASPSSGQALSANVWTKVQFAQELTDNLNNYDPSTSRFTAPQAGIYQINVSVLSLSISTSQTLQLSLYANGSAIRRLAYYYNSGSISSPTCLVGAAAVVLNAGDYIEVYGQSTAAITLSTGADNNLEITKIA